MPNTVDQNQYQLVQSLLQRQDETLEQLEALNLRVERAIEEVNSFRQTDPDQNESDSAELPVAVSKSDQGLSEAA